MEQLSNAITFLAFYTASKQGKTGIAVTADIYNPAGTHIVTAASATEIGDGLYSYTLASGSTGTEGTYTCVFKTADATVDVQHIAAVWLVGTAGIEDLDAAISSRSTLTDAQVWGYGSRGLTTFGSLVSDIWANTSRTLSAFAFSVTVGTNNDKTGYTVATVQDKTGYTLSSAGVQAIWDALTTALTTVGSVGKRVADNLDVIVSTRLATAGYTAPDNTSVTAIKAKTDNLPASPAATTDIPTAAAVADAVWNEPITDHLTAGSTGSALNAAGSAGDPWTTPLPGAYGAGTAGKILGGNLDTTVSSRLATAGYTAPDNADIIAIKAKTDNLPADPASNTQVNTRLATAGYTAPDNTDIVAIKTQTDKLIFTGTDVKATLDGETVSVGDKTGFSLISAYDAAKSAAAAGAQMDLVSVPNATAVTAIQSGLATAANLATVDTNVDAIKAKTDNLPVDPASNTEVDTRLSSAGYTAPDNVSITAIKAKTNLLPASPAATGDIPTVAQIWAGLSSTAANFIADHVLRRTFANTRASADGDAVSFRSLLGAIAKLVNKIGVNDTTLVVYQEDDTTALGSQIITTNATAEPITSLDTQ